MAFSISPNDVAKNAMQFAKSILDFFARYANLNKTC
jgi:hypothetical protein